jgi:hypothetical protein
MRTLNHLLLGAQLLAAAAVPAAAASMAAQKVNQWSSHLLNRHWRLLLLLLLLRLQQPRWVLYWEGPRYPHPSRTPLRVQTSTEG